MSSPKHFLLTLAFAIACGADPGSPPAASSGMNASGAAAPAPGKHRLSIDLTGPVGTAHIFSRPAGIFCPGTCSADYDDGTPVRVDILLPTGQGACMSGVDGCLNVSNCATLMNEDRKISWHFIDCNTARRPPKHRLTVDVTGPMGAAHLISRPAGIDCPGVCAADFDDGSLVMVDISLPQGQGACISNVQGCLNASNCTATMSEDRKVSWNFISCAR